jgi:phospholipid transport system substrate-binding protein
MKKFNIIAKVATMLAILSLTSLFGDDTDVVKKQFTKSFDSTITLLNDKALTTDQKYSKIIKTSESMFDFTLMAKLSLGKNWRKLDKAQQTEFVGLYKTKMQNSYASKIDNFTNSKVKIKFAKQLKPNKVVIYSSIEDNKKNSFDVDFKFHKPKIKYDSKEIWLVYDVLIKGVSIIKSDRAQFGAILNRGAVDNLMDKMREQ